jgi:hypothetical protein
LAILIIVSLTGYDVLVDQYLKSVLGDRAVMQIEFPLLLIVSLVSYGMVKSALHISDSKILNFRFYFARECFRVSYAKRDGVEKIKYLVLGLNSYNVYLTKKLKLRMNNVIICSKIIFNSSVDKNEAIRLIAGAFESEDKLNPIRCLSTLLKVKESEQLLMKEQITDKVKEIGALLIPVITITISIFDLISRTGK